MIYLVLGQDVFKQRQAVDEIIRTSGLQPEKFDGAELTENQLADTVAGVTLFSTERLVIVRDLSENKALWDKLAEWLGRVSSDTTLVLIEVKPDKRTKAYKAIAKAAKIITVDPWTDRQAGEAAKWLSDFAKQNGAKLSSEQVQKIIKRACMQGDRPGAYTIDQQVLANAILALSALENVDDEAISAVLPESTVDNVFELLDTAMGGDPVRTQQLMHNLQTTADPYMTLGFVMSQWSQLVALKVSGEQPDALAARIGVSAFVLKKLHRHASGLRLARVKQLTDLLARLDVQSKTTGANPWNLLARFIGELSK